MLRKANINTIHIFFTHYKNIIGMYAFHYQMNNTFIIIPNYFNEIHAHTRVILHNYIIKYMSMKNAHFFFNSCTNIFSKKKLTYNFMRFEAHVVRPCFRSVYNIIYSMPPVNLSLYIQYSSFSHRIYGVYIE